MPQKKNNNGFTLVEIMTALVIVTILMTVLGYIFLSSMNYFNFFGSKRNIKTMMDSILDYCKSNTEVATDIYLSDTEGMPVEWDEAKSDYICFSTVADHGKISTKNVSTFYSDDQMEGGTIKCNIHFNNDVESEISDPSKKRNIIIQIEFYDNNGELKDTRKRSIDVINLTYFKKDIKGSENGSELASDTDLNNDTKPIYLYFTKQPISSEDEYKEDEIWRALNKVFMDNTASDPEFYKNFVVNRKINATGSNPGPIGPVCHSHGILMWQYRADADVVVYPQQAFGNSPGRKGVDWLMIMDPDRFDKWGISKLNNIDVKSKTFYMVTYHFVQNTDKCDLLLYVHDSFYFDNIENNSKIRITQLIYNQEEDTWYYLPIGGTDDPVQEITRNGSKVNGFPVDENIDVGYTIKNGDVKNTYKTRITSSYQIKIFFKKYGKALVK